MKKNISRILEISKERKLSHIGSCLSVLPILEEIYVEKEPQDIVIMDNAHAHLAHLVVRENYEDIDASELIKGDIHCNRYVGCDSSGGSLGHGLGIGIGYALANPNNLIYVIVSDGSMMEGSNWEALRLIDYLKITNIKIYVNANGYSAVDKVDPYFLKLRINTFVKNIEFRITDNTKEFEGLKGHYLTI